MGSRTTTVIDLLEREWEKLEGSPVSARHLRRLAVNEPALAPFATLGQLRAAVEQAQANKNLAQVTWGRNKGLVEKGWVTPQQGDIDRFTLHAREAALGVAQANVAAQQAQLNVLYQQKAYQRVVAPFDGVVTQRNVDVGTSCTPIRQPARSCSPSCRAT